MKLKDLMQKCFIHQFYLKQIPNFKFLSNLFMLHLGENSNPKAKGDLGCHYLHKIRSLINKILDKFKTSFQTNEGTVDEGKDPNKELVC